MINLFDNKLFEGIVGAIIGALATILCFRTKLTELEKDQDEFRKETLLMFREIREDIKTLIGRRNSDVRTARKIIRDIDYDENDCI